MIPRRLVLRNFLSYRQCDLDFTGLKLAVLSGKNGDGKSALLDAMTWAVWGEARANQREADQLIRGSQQDMLVRFDFEANGERYEVVRKKTRNGAAQLDFFEHTDLGRKTLNGAGIRETQSEIVRHLRLDYDTFANSAFMAQGHAGEFTGNLPGKRKEIFGNILGLDLYERLKELAAEHRKVADAALKELRQRVGQATADIARLPVIETGIAAAATRLEELAPIVTAAQDRAAGLQAIAADFERARQIAAEAAAAFKRAEQELERETTELNSLEKALATAVNALVAAPEVEARHAALQEARREGERLARAQTAANQLEQAILRAESEIASQRSRLETQVENLHRELAALEADEAKATALAPQQARLAGEETEIAALRATLETHREALNPLAAGHARAETEMAEYIRRGNESKAETAAIEKLQASASDVNCPVCLRPLAAADIRQLLDDYSTHRRQLGEVYRIAKIERDRIAGEAASLQAMIDRASEECQRRDVDVQLEHRQLAAELARAQDAAGLLPARRDALAHAMAALSEEGFAAEARELIGKARDELARISYDADVHRVMRERVTALRPVEDEMRAIEAARALASAHGPRAKALRSGLPGRQAEGERARKAAAAAANDVKTATDVGPQLREAQAELAAARAEEADLYARIGGLAKERELLIARQAQLEDEQRREVALADEASVHGELEKAFGRDGIQAMLIDQSLPSVEHHANDLLDKMTNGRIRVQLATQRRLKNRNLEETLDINISDEVGVRPYAMYSGGEAFRVDFALRIALARLLAERAGAELPMLIIDEGFGSQDADGIDRLVEAIQAVSQDFRLILVVTHVDALRDRFEQRIEVTKDAIEGSTARVVA